MMFVFKNKIKKRRPARFSKHEQQTKAGEELSRIDLFIQKMEQIDATTPEQFGDKLLSLIARENEIIQGALFLADSSKKSCKLKFVSGYACDLEVCKTLTFDPGEGFPGQVFSDRTIINLRDFPEGYMKIRTGLGEASPRSLLLFPLLHSGDPVGVVELASFGEFQKEDELFYGQLSETIARKFKNLKTKKKSQGA